MTQKLKYLLIGCGTAGAVHAYHFSKSKEIEAVACVDTNEKNAQKFKNDFGFKKASTNLEEILETEQFDVCSIATPPCYHAAQIEAAFQKKINTLCEKPLFISERQALKTLALYTHSPLLLGVMLPRRFYNNSLAVAQAIRDESFGTITNVVFDLQTKKDDLYYQNWRGKKKFVGGGVLMSQAIHSIDQLVFFFGKPVSVTGQIKTTRATIDVEDEAVATIEFKGGIKVNLQATTNSKTDTWRGLTTIEGKKGKVVLDSQNILEWDLKIPPPSPEEVENIQEKFKPNYYGPGHYKVIRHFIQALTNHFPLRIKAGSSMLAHQIIWGIYQSSSEKGKLISF